MRKQKKILPACMASIFAALAYFFLCWTPLQTELRLTPEWTIDIDKTPDPATSEARIPFRLLNKAGYFTHSGKIALTKTIPYKAVFSQSYWALYSRDAENTPLYTPSGQEKCVIKGAGFPFIQEDRIFLFAPGGSSLAFVNSVDGGTSSVYENTAPITAFNSSKEGCAAGYADGQFIIFDKQGKKRVELFPGGSDYSVVLGADISESGKLFACVCGLDPQRFVLYRDEGSYEKIIFHSFMKKNLTRQTYVHFSKNDQWVYYDSVDSLGIVDTQKGEQKTIPLAGMILDIQESPVSQSVYILSRLGSNSYTVTILENWNQKTGEFSFDADAAFILADSNTLYVGRDNKISKIVISKN